MRRKPRPASSSSRGPASANRRGKGKAAGGASAEGRLRIIGGRFRGRVLERPESPGVRPMKDRTREATFNLLGPPVAGKHALDLFAGSGALGLEALSRGADSATLIERHVPTSRVIQNNAALLGLTDQVELVRGDVFVWAAKPGSLQPPPDSERPADRPWVVFCSPPYDLFVERPAELLDLLERLIAAAPATSLFVVESDERFDPAQLPAGLNWDTRRYRPALLSVAETLAPN